MQINTTRFGNIEIDHRRIIEFSQGLPGFPGAKRFILLEHAPQNPFHWLQSLDDPALAFVVMDPLGVEPHYRQAIPGEALRALGLPSVEEAVILTIVTIDRTTRRVTTNLLGPLVIHPETRMGEQVVLEGSPYSTKHDLVTPGQTPRQEARTTP